MVGVGVVVVVEVEVGVEVGVVVEVEVGVGVEVGVVLMNDPTDRKTVEDLPTVRMTKLRAVLLSFPYPQYQIAGLAGVHPTKLSAYSRGEKSMSSKHLLALCHVLNCEPEDIIGWVDRPVKS